MMLMFIPFCVAVAVAAAPVTSGEESISLMSARKLKLLLWKADATRRNSGSLSKQGAELAKKHSFCVVATAKRLVGLAASATSLTERSRGPKSSMLAPVALTVLKAKPPPVVAGRGLAAAPLKEARAGKSLRSLKSSWVPQNWRMGSRLLWQP